MKLCIIGTGYVGLVTAACFAEMGNHVICVDANPDVVARLKNGDVHIYEPGLEDLVTRGRKQGRLDFTTDLKEGLSKSRFVFYLCGHPAARRRHLRSFPCVSGSHGHRPHDG